MTLKLLSTSKNNDLVIIAFKINTSIIINQGSKQFDHHQSLHVLCKLFYLLYNKSDTLILTLQVQGGTMCLNFLWMAISSIKMGLEVSNFLIFRTIRKSKYHSFVESPNTDMLLRDLLLITVITHHYIQSNSKTS